MAPVGLATANGWTSPIDATQRVVAHDARVPGPPSRSTTFRARPAALSRCPCFLYHHRMINTHHGTRNDQPNRTQTLTLLQPGDVRGIWKQDRLGRSLPHLIEIIIGLKTAGVGFRSPTEQLDTATPHGERWFDLIEAPAQHEQALTQERIRAALAGGASKAAGCRTFGIPRSTYDALGRAGD